MTIIPDLPSRSFTPHRYRPGGIGNWSGHLPFAYDLVAALRPETIVELGTHYGESFFGFCQSVQENHVPAVCYAVDTWRGEEQSGFYGESVLQDVETYNRAHYASFSSLIRGTFDEAVSHFADGSIGLLHIDGLHTYEAVSHDFNRWLPKVKPGGVVLMHDIIVRSPGFEVWRLWEELARRFPSFAFHHSLGLGVLRIGDWPATSLDGEPLLALLFGSGNADLLRRYYVMLADTIEFRSRLSEQQLRSNDVVCTKVYPCSPGGYGEATSESALIETGKWHRLTMELRHGSEAGPIRVDPCDAPAIIDIAEIRVRDADTGTILWQSDHNSEFAGIEPAYDVAILSRSDVLRCFSFGFDPQLILRGLTDGAGQQTLFVDVWLRIDKQLAAVIPALFGGPGIPADSDDSASSTLRAQYDVVVRINERLSAELRRLEREQFALTAEMRSLMSARASTQEDSDSARSELEAADLRVKEYNVRFSAVLGELSALRGQLAERRKAMEEYQRRLTTLQQELETVRHDNAALHKGLAERRQQVQEILTSLSWRLTSPLRSIGALLHIRRGSE